MHRTFRRKVYFFMLLITSLLIASVLAADKLLQIQTLWRHGARTPIYCNWNCQFFKERGWLDGYLTPTGLRQHFVLGTWMRSQYVENSQNPQMNILKREFDRNEISVRATDVNRTILSAMANLQGMYPEGTGPRVPNVDKSFLQPPNITVDVPDLNDFALHHQIQVVPVSMRLQLDDEQLRGYGTPVCARAGQWQQSNMHSHLSHQVSEKAAPLLMNFCNQMNIDPATFTIYNLSEYQDTFDSSEYGGFAMPPTLEKETLAESQKLYPLSIALKLYQTPDQVNIMSSPFLQMLTDNMQGSINKSDPIKYHIFSAHDVTVQLVAIALNLTSAQCIAEYYVNGTQPENCIVTYPTYATTILFELWEDESTKDYYVKLRYDGKYLNICGGKSQKCSFETFRDLIKAQQRDFDEECALPMDSMVVYKVPGWMVTLTVISIFLLVGLVAYSLYLIAQSRKGHKLEEGFININETKV